jgi:hypothetical protein
MLPDASGRRHCLQAICAQLGVHLCRLRGTDPSGRVAIRRVIAKPSSQEPVAQSTRITRRAARFLSGPCTNRFRIKIWRHVENLKQDVVVYDNQLSSSSEGTLSEGSVIGAGTIVIHTLKN